MKKYLILLLLVVSISNQLLASDISLEDIRMEFYKITIDSKDTPQLLEKLYSHSNPDALIIGYTAATEAIMAKVVWNPYSKFSYLYKSKNTFVKAINMNSRSDLGS